jgi:hypothetical protein
MSVLLSFYRSFISLLVLDVTCNGCTYLMQKPELLFDKKNVTYRLSRLVLVRG